MRRSSQAAPGGGLRVLLTILGVVALLSFGSPVLIPVALSILLSFLLAPVVTQLERLGLGRVPSVLVTALVAFVIFVGIGWLVAAQIFALANRLPQYKSNIEKRMSSLSSPGETGPLGRLVSMFNKPDAPETEETTGTVTATTKGPAGFGAAGMGALKSFFSPAVPGRERSSPTLVEVVDRPPNAFRFVTAMLRPLAAPIGTIAVVIVFVLFMLLRREDLRDRIIHLIGNQNLNATTQAIDEAGLRVGRYLLMHLVVNVSYGVPVGIGLYLIGVPYAPLWGVLAILFRFIPFLGPLLSAALPLALSLAVFDGWTGPLLTLGLFVVLELISNNVIEPWLYGSSTGISAVALLVAAVFWSWLWGIPGLVLSTPLTVCLVVLGRYVPQLCFLDLLLSDRPELPPEGRMYQRLLAMKPDEVTQLAEEYLEEHSVAELYAEVLVPALSLAEEDRHRGEIEAPRQRFILRALRELVDQTAEQLRMELETKRGTPVSPDEWEQGQPDRPAILCFPANDEADRLVGRMMVQLLRSEGYRARVLPIRARGLGERDLRLLAQADAVCISALPPFAVSHARLVCKRLCSRCPQQKTVIGLWNARTDALKARERLQEACPPDSRIVTTLSEALEVFSEMTASPAEGPCPQQPLPGNAEADESAETADPRDLAPENCPPKPDET